MHHLILASESPRRREILERAGFRFSVIPSKVSEIPDENLNAVDQISLFARQKAEAVWQFASKMQTSPFVVLSADTEVIFNERPLGKPSSPQNAFEMLSRLSGQMHEVTTSVCLIESSTKRLISHNETTLVFFRALTPKEISDYVATKEPMDKAGAYGIQGCAKKFIDRIEGDYDNVVGLPLHSLISIFKKEGWIFR